MECKYYLVSTVNNQEKNPQILLGRATKGDAFSSDLLSEHWVGSEDMNLIKGSFCKCQAQLVKEDWDAFYSVLCIVNRITSKVWSAGTLLCNYVSEKEGEPSCSLQFWKLERKKKTPNFFFPLENWVKRAHKACRHKRNGVCLGQFWAYGFTQISPSIRDNIT